MADLAPTVRTTVKRRAARASYEVERIHAILDEGLVCHLAYAAEGQPWVIPTTYGRLGDQLYVHGAAASRTLAALGRGLEACVTVTLLDGLVLARSAFRHSMNYRSVVIFGVATPVTDPTEKAAALHAIVEHIIPGRWPAVRPPTAQELEVTSVLRLPIDEASAKVRSGPPLDNAEDVGRPCWAGVIPLRLTALPPVRDPELPTDVVAPAAVTFYARRSVA
jgi:nitroimidazol reductase NimA-like FMN-containing flavoprotein (pyridoxamine 5'-phosphate oxidase superfamily)